MFCLVEKREWYIVLIFLITSEIERGDLIIVFSALDKFYTLYVLDASSINGMEVVV